jgi:hypothetical protein
MPSQVGAGADTIELRGRRSARRDRRRLALLLPLRGGDEGVGTAPVSSTDISLSPNDSAPTVAGHGERVRFVYRLFPPATHQRAAPAARTAHAACLQGKCGKTDDLLQRQTELVGSVDPRLCFESYAEAKKAEVGPTPWFVMGATSRRPSKPRAARPGGPGTR